MSENTRIQEVEQIEQNEEKEANQEDLHYKEAYTFLFNSLSDISKMQTELLKEIIRLQRQAEAICTTGLPNDKIPPELILELLANMIKANNTKK